MADAFIDVAGKKDEMPFSLKPLMFQTFACTMAMMAFTALAGPIGRTLGLAPWQMGIAVTVAGISWILTARLWGRASDRRGRRSVMLLGLGGFAVCYVILCLVTALALRGWMSSLAAFAGLVAWRGLAGAFYAAVPAGGAALIADHVAPEKRAGAMATVGMAGGASMVVGPAMAALFAPYGLELPLHLIALLPAVAFVVLWRTLPRTGHRPPSPTGPSPRWGDPRLRRPTVAAFVSMLGVSTAQIVVGFYAIDRLGLTPQEGAQVAGMALTCVGVALTVAQMAVRGLRWAPENLIRAGAATAALGFLAAAFAATPAMLCGCHFLAAAGMGLVWPSISALAANAVERHEQGAAAGTVSAAQGMGTILGPLAGTAIYALDVTAPYLLVAGLLAGLVPWGERSLAKKNA